VSAEPDASPPQAPIVMIAPRVISAPHRCQTPSDRLTRNAAAGTILRGSLSIGKRRHGRKKTGAAAAGAHVSHILVTSGFEVVGASGFEPLTPAV
jgi:hypothetical protein